MPSKTIEDFAYQVRDYMRGAEVVEGKNYFNPSISSGTVKDNITYTVNSDKSISANGTTSANTYIELGKVTLSAGTYMLSGLPTAPHLYDYRLRLTDANEQAIAWDDGEGAEFTISETQELSLRFRYEDNVVIDHITIYTMICTLTDWEKSHTYEPYYVPVKDRFDYMKIAEATKNQTWSAQLSTLHTAYSALSDEDKMRCVISAGDNFAYGKYSLQAVLAEAFAMNNLDGYGKFSAICMRLSNQTVKMVNIVSDGTTTLTDLSSETNTIKMVLYKTP